MYAIILIYANCKVNSYLSNIRFLKIKKCENEPLGW